MEDENVKETERVVVRKTTANSTLKTTDLANETENQGLFFGIIRSLKGQLDSSQNKKRIKHIAPMPEKKSSAGEGENARGAEHQPSQAKDENFHFYSGSSTQFTDSPGR